METGKMVAKADSCFSGKKESALKEYESVKISFSRFEQADVLTESVGFVGDDNVGGFLGVWGN